MTSLQGKGGVRGTERVGAGGGGGGGGGLRHKNARPRPTSAEQSIHQCTPKSHSSALPSPRGAQELGVGAADIYLLLGCGGTGRVGQRQKGQCVGPAEGVREARGASDCSREVIYMRQSAPPLGCNGVEASEGSARGPPDQHPELLAPRGQPRKMIAINRR